jgi:hypothetical protein
MSEQSAWEWVRTNLYNHSWTPIPDSVRMTIKFHPMVGCYQGNLITRKSANYAAGVVSWLNRERSIA